MGDVVINDSNDVNVGDDMSNTSRGDDADGGAGNSNNGGGVDENKVFDTKGADETDGGDEKNQSFVCGFA